MRARYSNSSVVAEHRPSEIIQVNIRLTFLRIGEIDTLNEKYHAHAVIEARWLVNFDLLQHVLSNDEHQRLVEGKSVSLGKYAESQWHPQLFIENALGDLKEQVTYSAKRSAEHLVYVCEQREIKGLFWETLELHHFPSDVQQLSISVGSMFFNDKVILQADPLRLSGINREAFVDQQEWSLYEHVDTSQRAVKEFLLNNDDEAETPSQGHEERKRSFLVVSCHAARRSAYFYWNGFYLMFLITICGFCIFSIPPTLPQNRLQIGVTLLLTSITFRWTVNRSLPTISYLTSLDKYSILSIFILVVLCIWFAVIGTLVFAQKHSSTGNTTDRFVWIDRYVFFACCAVFLLMHLVMLIWLWAVPLAFRRRMEQKDDEYRLRNAAKGKVLRAETIAHGQVLLPITTLY